MVKGRRVSRSEIIITYVPGFWSLKDSNCTSLAILEQKLKAFSNGSFEEKEENNLASMRNREGCYGEEVGNVNNKSRPWRDVVSIEELQLAKELPT